MNDWTKLAASGKLTNHPPDNFAIILQCKYETYSVQKCLEKIQVLFQTGLHANELSGIDEELFESSIEQ